MAIVYEVLESLETLIQYATGDTIKINKTTLVDIQICLQNAQEKIEFLQLESQLHSKPVSVQKIERDSHQQQEYKVAVDSHSMPSIKAYLQAEAKIQPTLPIIRPWEELVHNKHRTGLGYDKDVSFHISDYSKPIKFQSVGFLYDGSPVAVPDPTPLPQQQQ